MVSELLLDELVVTLLELLPDVPVLELVPPPVVLELLQACAAIPSETAVRAPRAQAMFEDFIRLCLSVSTHACAPICLYWDAA